MDKRIQKIGCLGYGKRKERTAKIAQAVTELRYETGCSLSIILKAIKELDELSHIIRSRKNEMFYGHES